ncbi:PTS sugar transporter subunit IIAB [Mycoplasma hyorhinis]|uniref:PTS sugar transporter subunit IIA n=1 Tax=Mesomycoplasma hyorhinis TaxID=2100 RepID=UPI00136B0859|nr:PTS sugar transporter subunit IIA [Mesomycoplasma hyorhinis]MXR08141.1 PTS sugar transporter subunit IIAB [Mesomycoplasma hyorhinis]
MDLLKTLKKFNSIQLNLEAKNWQEAIWLSVQPLIEKNAITQDYYNAIIESTIKNGPYYIIANDLAMPHAQSERGVKENAFSLITLKKPVFFDNDDRPVRILIALAATSPEIHTSVALPQIVAAFEDESVVKQILQAKEAQQVIDIILNIDFKKYLS